MGVAKKTNAKKRGTPFSRLLGSVVVPELPAGTDYRDVSDAKGEALGEAARRDPENFYRVLTEERTLLDRDDVVWSLGYEKDPRATPLLVVALRSKLHLVRAAAANGLMRRRDASIVDPLIAALRDRSPIVRQRVIEALGKQRNARAIAPLRAAATTRANQKNDYIQRLIAAALARLEKR
jgi:HEAT repeat protein